MAVRRLLGLQHGVVLPVRIDATGERGPRAREAAGAGWRKTSRGLYVPAEVAPTAHQRIAEVGILLPRYAAITGWAALAWQEGWQFSGLRADGSSIPVPVALSGRRIRPQPGLQLCEERWTPKEVRIVDGLPVLSPARAVCHEIRYAYTSDAAIVALDMAAFHDLVSLEEALAWAHEHPSYTGIELCRQTPGRSSENSWSHMETRMRLDLEVAGHSQLLANQPVFDLNGRHIGTPDLLDPASGVAFEYDGFDHALTDRRAMDLRRQHDFATHGIEIVTMVSGDRRDLGPFFARVRTAYSNASHRTESEKRWTLTMPAWWQPTITVSERRALSEHQRGIWLRQRRSPYAGRDSA